MGAGAEGWSTETLGDMAKSRLTEIAELGSARAGPGQGRAGDGREQGQGRGSLSGRVARAVSDGWAGRGLSA